MMRTPVSAWLALGLSFTCLSACSKKTEAPAQPVAAEAPQTSPVAEPAVKPSACAMVTQEQMSEILGKNVVGASDESSSGVTKCEYTAPTSLSPDAWVSVEWGEAETARMGARMANTQEPGLANPLAGLGDEAFMTGPVLFVISGDDVIQIYLPGVPEIAPSAAKVLALLQPKL
jgi:hypothetical protein